MQSHTVLIAEHDPMQRQLLDLLFSVDGYSLSIVGSGEEALAHLREHTPQAIVLATDLPGLPGTAICQKIRAVTRLAHVPVVLISPESPGGGLSDAIRLEARRAGADLVVQKPLGDKNLRERLQRLIAAPPRRPVPPAARASTTAAELPELEFSPHPESPSVTATIAGAATELGGLRAEVARLRAENEQLTVRVTTLKERAKSLEEALEKERRRPRGLFSRRS